MATYNSSILTVEEAKSRAEEARREGLRGHFPYACIILGEEIKRWEEWYRDQSFGIIEKREFTYPPPCEKSTTDLPPNPV
jgi:hypothetical protein